MRIDKLTKEQAARIPEWVEKWLQIGLSTAPADFEAATEAALRAYKLCNLGRPMVILRVSSPYAATLAGAFAWMLLREFAKRGAVQQQVWQQVGQQVGQQVWQQVWQQVRQQVGQQVRQQVGQQVGQQVRQQVRQQVGQQVGQQVWQQVWQQGFKAASEGFDNYGINQLWSSWGAHISFFRDVCGWIDPVLDRFEIDEALMKSCGWTWWHQNVLVISDRPDRLERDAQGRLHSESGPSIRYRDGWALHHWHGVLMPEYVIERPHEITVPRIESEQNAEVRRVMVSRYGAGRFLLDSGAELVNRDDCGILYRKPVAGDEPIVMVRVLNPTPEHDGSLSETEARKVFGDELVERNLTAMARIGFALQGSRPKFKEYMLRVDPECRPLLENGQKGVPQKMTARNAVASTFGKRGEEWQPGLET